MIEAIAEGEANFWFLQDEKKWFVRIQFNGEITKHKQQETVNEIKKLF